MSLRKRPICFTIRPVRFSPAIRVLSATTTNTSPPTRRTPTTHLSPTQQTNHLSPALYAPPLLLQRANRATKNKCQNCPRLLPNRVCVVRHRGANIEESVECKCSPIRSESQPENYRHTAGRAVAVATRPVKFIVRILWQISARPLLPAGGGRLRVKVDDPTTSKIAERLLVLHNSGESVVNCKGVRILRA